MIDTADLEHILAHTLPLWEAVRGKRLFLTGGTGFVGSWLLESFVHANRELALGASAVVLSRDPASFARRIERLASATEVTYLRGSGTDFRFPDGPFQFIIHAATERSFTPDAKHPLGIVDPDIATTRRVLEFARQCDVRRMLFTSSGAVYGKIPSDRTHIDEEYPGAPLTTDAGSAYGQSKRMSEFLCSMYAATFGLEISIGRLFAFVGPRLPLDEGYAVGNFLADALANRPIAVGGDGTPLRSYLYAADLAIWLWTILFRGAPGRAYNVGSPDSMTIEELAGKVARIPDVPVPVRIALMADADVPPPRYVPDTNRAQAELGLRVRVSVDEGIRRTYAWHRARMLASRG